MGRPYIKREDIKRFSELSKKDRYRIMYGGEGKEEISEKYAELGKALAGKIEENEIPFEELTKEDRYNILFGKKKKKKDKTTLREKQCAKCTNSDCHCKTCRGTDEVRMNKFCMASGCGFNEHKSCSWLEAHGITEEESDIEPIELPCIF